MHSYISHAAVAAAAVDAADVAITASVTKEAPLERQAASLEALQQSLSPRRLADVACRCETDGQNDACHEQLSLAIYGEGATLWAPPYLAGSW
jgi:hypothetical protein